MKLYIGQLRRLIRESLRNSYDNIVNVFQLGLGISLGNVVEVFDKNSQSNHTGDYYLPRMYSRGGRNFEYGYFRSDDRKKYHIVISTLLDKGEIDPGPWQDESEVLRSERIIAEKGFKEIIMSLIYGKNYVEKIMADRDVASIESNITLYGLRKERTGYQDAKSTTGFKSYIRYTRYDIDSNAIDVDSMKAGIEIK